MSNFLGYNFKLHGQLKTISFIYTYGKRTSKDNKENKTLDKHICWYTIYVKN